MAHISYVPALQAIGVTSLGYGVSKSGIIAKQDSEVAKLCGLHVLTPAVILQSFARSQAPQLSWAIAAGATVFLMLAALGSIWVMARKRHRIQRALLLGTSVGGAIEATTIPLLYLLAGPVAVQLAAVTGLVHFIVAAAGSYWLCSTSQAAYPKSYRHEDGGLYDGQWQGRNKQGLGTYQYPGGAKYKGEWRNNNKEGRGVYTFLKGGNYEGEWRAGNRAGLGIRTMRSGKVLAGQWEEGQLVVPMEEWQCAVAAESAHAAAQAASRVPVGQANLATAMQQIVMTPPLLATIAGIVLSLLHSPLPPTVQRATDVLAVVNAPLMLLTFGASLDFSPIPTSQWQDVCQVAAVRHVPSLVLLAAVLLGTGMLGAALPLHWLTALLVANVSALAPIPSQVSSYVQRFNLSQSLAASISKFSAWVSSAILLALLLATLPHQTSAAGGLSNIAHTFAATRASLLAVALAAMAVLLASIPLAGNAVQRACRQDQQQVRLPSTASTGGTVSAITLATSTSAGALQQSKAATSTSSQIVDAAHQAADQAVQAADLNARSPATEMSMNEQLGDSVAPSTTDRHDIDSVIGPQEPGSESQVPDVIKRQAFFRDISTDCLPCSRSFGRHVQRQHTYLRHRRSKLCQTHRGLYANCQIIRHSAVCPPGSLVM